MYFYASMSCLKLTYYENQSPLKVVHRKPVTNKKVVQWFIRIDPLAENYNFQSPFAYAANNPIRYIDWMGMGPDDPQPGSAQIYVKLGGSFGPQLGFNIGDLIGGVLRATNVTGETKVGISISPEGKIGFLFEQSSKNVNYEMKGSIPVLGGKSKSSEYGTKEHSSFAVEKKETQKGLVKETQTESDESITTVESTTYEVGVGVNAVIVGAEVGIGFEYIENTKTETKSAETQKTEKKEDKPQ